MDKNFKKINNTPEVYYVPFPKESEKVLLDIAFKEGSANDPNGFIGITHLLEHYLLSEYQTASNFEVKANAVVGFEYSAFYIESNKEDIIKDANVFLESILGKRSFDNKKRIKEEISVITNELEEKMNNTDFIVDNNLKKAFLEKDCPYFKDYSQELENIKRIGPEELKERYSSLFTQRNMVITIGGHDLSKEILEDMNSQINKYDLPKGKDPIYKSCNFIKRKETNISVPNLENNYASLIFPGISFKNSLKDRIMSNIVCKIVTDASNVDVFKRLRDLGMYGVDYNNYFYQNFGIIMFLTNLEISSTEKFFNVIISGIEKIIKNGPNEKILKRMKAGSIEGNKEDWDSNVGRYQWIIEDIIDLDQVDDIDEVIRSIDSITKKDIQEWMKKYLNPDLAKKVVLTKE